MFGVDWSNPETFWLNAINLMLGLVTLACVGAIAYGLAGDLLAKVRQRTKEAKDLHALHLPELGLTMADGGEPVADQPQSKKKQ